MNYKDEFKTKCNSLQTYLKELNRHLDNIKERIIIRDLEEYFKSNEKDVILSAGSNVINIDDIEEITICGEICNIINKRKNKYFGFVTILDKDFCTIGLGFMYKGNIIAPHSDLDFAVDNILSEYNANEIQEISDIIDDKIARIKMDIEYIKTHKDLNCYKYHYGEYNKGFLSDIKFDTVNEVIEFYHKI